MGIVPSDQFAEELKTIGEEAFLCFQCHRCSAGCPTSTAMSIPPSKMMRIAQLGMKERLIRDPSIWRCLGCDTCTEHCPHKVSVRKLVEHLRQDVMQNYWLEDTGEIASGDEDHHNGLRNLNMMSDKVKRFHNVSGEDNENRLAWTSNLPEMPEGIDRKENADVVYFVGCVSAMFPMSYSIPQNFAKVLMNGNVSFTTLGSGEWCCGFPLMMSGQLKQARNLMRHNVETVRSLGAKQVVMTCPSCHYMWKHVYGKELKEDLEFDIVTASEMIYKLVHDGKLRYAETKKPGTVTYHDPCDLGRKGGHFDEPREIVKSVPGFTFVEMQNSKTHALCCGGGGDLETFQPELTTEVSAKRIFQAAAVDAEYLVSACPQCVRTLSKAAKAQKLRIRVMDIVQFVGSSL